MIEKREKATISSPEFPPAIKKQEQEAALMSTLQRVQLPISKEKQLIDVALARSLPLRQLWKATHGGWLRSAIFVDKCH